MKHFTTLTLAAALLACVATAYAFPTVGSINETNALALVSQGTLGAITQNTGGPTGGLQVATTETQQGIVVAMDRSELEIARIPSTRLLVGINPNWEVGAAIEDFDGEGIGGANLWNLNTKYALPMANGKVAGGVVYNRVNTSEDLIDTEIWNYYLAGSLPVMEDATVTANVMYTSINEDIPDNNDISYSVNFEKMFANGTKAGAEWLFSLGGFQLDTDLDKKEINYGNIYVVFPVNEMLTGRAALSGIGKFTTFTVGLQAAFGAAAE